MTTVRCTFSVPQVLCRRFHSPQEIQEWLAVHVCWPAGVTEFRGRLDPLSQHMVLECDVPVALPTGEGLA